MGTGRIGRYCEALLEPYYVSVGTLGHSASSPCSVLYEYACNQIATSTNIVQMRATTTVEVMTAEDPSDAAMMMDPVADTKNLRFPSFADCS
jgi:hypothetical protein